MDFLLTFWVINIYLIFTAAFNTIYLWPNISKSITWAENAPASEKKLSGEPGAGTDNCKQNKTRTHKIKIKVLPGVSCLTEWLL